MKIYLYFLLCCLVGYTDWGNFKLVIYSSFPLSVGDTFQDPQWMLETADNTKHYIYYVFFLYIHTYDKV